ncbi:MAG: hypothetical protein QOH48_1735 [Actinomycetota bacterium]|jgi:hypothetical protein|nr:hypothetical protein [Actinomycetota bacterium]
MYGWESRTRLGASFPAGCGGEPVLASGRGGQCRLIMLKATARGVPPFLTQGKESTVDIKRGRLRQQEGDI